MLLKRSCTVLRRVLPSRGAFLSKSLSTKATNIQPFLLADIGEGIAEVELMKWFVKEGEQVKAFDRICEVQSDKATVEITSKYDGKVVAVHHEEGAIVNVGSALVDIATEGDGTDGSSSAVPPVLSSETDTTPVLSIPPSAPKAEATTIQPFLLADIGEGIAEVELIQWFVKEGEQVKAFDRICEVQSDKATVEITSKYDGKVVAVHHEEGAIVNVGSALVDIATEGGSPGGSSSPKSTAPIAASPSPITVSPNSNAAPFHNNSNGNILTTPAVRKIAKENNLNLSNVAGTGPRGRILKEDVLNFLRDGGQARSSISQNAPTTLPVSAAPASASSAARPEQHFSNGQDEVIPIRGIKRLMVKSMQAAQQIQHLTLCEEVNMNNLVETRAELKVEAEKRGIKLSYMPFIIKAASMALEQYPMLNATVSADVTSMTYHANHNIGVAVDTPQGLVVPVIKSVQSKSILEIAQEMAKIQELASTGKLTEKDLQGGTFTLTNIGSIGGTYATPVLVAPQVAIGAFGRMQVLPRYINSSGKEAKPSDVAKGDAEMMPTNIMNISWSADHRVVDGATVARFNNAWKGYIEHPSTMLMGMR